MLQLRNETPFKAGMAIFPDADGVDTLYVAIRATFTVKGAAVEVAEVQEPVRLADEYFGEPDQSSLKHAADLHLGKPSTDVVLLGEAVAPGGEPVPELDVVLSVGPVQKVVRVFGDREWSGLFGSSISKPKPFTRMPLLYERAFGGVVHFDEKKNETQLDWRNPVGVGFGKRKAPGDQAMRGLPNLEAPASLISSPRDRPPPAGFGPIAPFWEPRRSFAGTYDDAWQARRAPFLPKDFQARFFNAAHPDLVCKRYLRGGEPVQIINASPSPLRFNLPACALDVAVKIDGSSERPAMNLQTVVLEPLLRRVGLVWFGAVGCDKKPLKVSEVQIGMKKLELPGSAP